MDDVDNNVKVFGLWASPFSQRVVWALKLKGVSYEYIGEDLVHVIAMRNARVLLLLQYNPIFKKVPVLVHRGKPIAESMVILEYTWPHNPLLPQDAHERSNVRFLSKFIDEKTIHMISFIRYDGEQQERAIKETLETLRVIEKESGLNENKNFIGGNTIGLGDIALGWIAHTLVALEDVVGVKFITYDAFPCLHSWVGNFLEIPVIRNNLPSHEMTVEYFKEKREMFLATAAHGCHHYHHH